MCHCIISVYNTDRLTDSRSDNSLPSAADKEPCEEEEVSVCE